MSCAVVFFLFLALAIPSSNGSKPRKLDGVPEGVKCGGCPCDETCTPPSPPPPSPSLPPPPPSLPPPLLPPPPKRPPTNYCPPPPSGGDGGFLVPNPPNNTPQAPQYVYATGPPGALYPVDQTYSGARKGSLSEFSNLIGGISFGFLFVLENLW
ncbi:hypothetical protein DM860_017385 [Cuscuta australis]|uniref:Uncharacterized protein n=1 Tax=Cuscuta australis TaxID=267555 RepID=A0A328DQF7_9ASTE|nr:hypothetical protein DM860_017385 [Cuscuta australis]